MKVSPARATARIALVVVASAAGLLASTAPARAADVGVSIGISQPGVYGRIDIGRFPQPQVIVQQPVVIYRPYPQVVEPVYLWVPPGHQKNWRQHCGRYNACGVPVYFVQDQWYGEHVQGHGKDKHKDKDHYKGHGKGKGKHDD